MTTRGEVRFTLTIDVTYQLRGTRVSELELGLYNAAQHVAAQAALGTDAQTLRWDSRVQKKGSKVKPTAPVQDPLET